MDPDRRASLRRRLDLDEGLLTEKTKDVLLSMLDELIEEGTLPMLLDKLKDASVNDGVDYDNILTDRGTERQRTSQTLCRHPLVNS